MSDMSDRPKRKAIKSEKQLKSFEAAHNIYIVLFIKWFVALLFMAAFVVLFIAVAVYVFAHPETMAEITKQVFDNIGSIVVAAAVFLGLKKFPGTPQ